MANRTQVFISYSHRDKMWLERLQVHLKPLVREGMMIWDDTKIQAGTKWKDAIRQALDSAKVAVVLISADFLASDFIATDELPPLLAAANQDGAVILPVIVSASRFTRIPSLAQFQAVNSPNNPLIDLSRGEQERILVEVSEAIKDALTKCSPYPRGTLALKPKRSTSNNAHPEQQHESTRQGAIQKSPQSRGYRKLWVKIVFALIASVGTITAAFISIGIKNGNENSFSYPVRVQDKATGQAIERASVVIYVPGKAPLDEITDTNGFTRIFIPVSYANQPSKLMVEASGFKKHIQNLDLTGYALPKDISLEKKQHEPERNISENSHFSSFAGIANSKGNGIRISFDEAISNDHIRGTVEGLNPEIYRDYKVVVYRFTDQWYIHPYETGAEGRRFALINDDGTWKIKAVWRRNPASRLALLLTKRTTNSPSVVSAETRNPEESLLAQINTVAHHIIDAPEGI